MSARSFVRIAGPLTLAVLLLFATITVASAERPEAPGGARVIVTLEAGASSASARGAMARLGILPVKDLPAADAIVAYVPSAIAERLLEADQSVASIEPDYVVSVVGKPAKPDNPGKPPSTSRQSLPWGVDRIDAELAWATTRGAGVKVGIIDTGIDLTHPDLAANIAGGFSAVSYTTSADDDYGHGTHVAGIVAAADNGVGVVGVAPDASLYALKALDHRGSGWTSDIIECIDWAIAADLDVINMSLGSPYPSSTFQDAITRANVAGIVVVASAGNSGPTEDTVAYPGAYAGVIAVSATDATDALATFSSRGPEVDLAAPGASIYSTYWNARRGAVYATLSGTSMAAPHVAGAAALVLADLGGAATPLEVETLLEQVAEDLGAEGADTWYGEGLVDALAAVQ